MARVWPRNRLVRNIILVILVIVSGVAGWLIWNKPSQPKPYTGTPPTATIKSAEVTTFAECTAAGNPIQESYPEVCVSKDGQHFTNPDQKAPAAPPASN